MTNIKLSAMALGLVIIGTGCAQGTSGSVPTEEIAAYFRVVGDSAGSVECRATFTHGAGLGGTYLELTDGDTATCSDGTQTVTLSMDEDPIIGTIHYETTALTYDPSRTYTLTFTRGSGDSYSAEIPLPDAVSIGSPAPGAVVTKGNSVPVTWNAGDGHDVYVSLAWSTSGHSSYSYERSADDGSYILGGSATLVQDSNGNTLTGDVTATLAVERSITVAHPSPLQGSSVGEQSRSVSITLRD